MKKESAFYLKRLAALQFAGSIENYSTRNPIHLLQEKSSDQYEITEEKAEELYVAGDRVSVVCEITGDSYESLEDLIRAESDEVIIHEDESIEEYNARIKDTDTLFLPIISLEEALEANEIPGCIYTIYNIRNYLDAYGVGECFFFAYESGWDMKAVAFTHKGAEEARAKFDNHIFNDTRSYAFANSNEEFTVLMEYLREQGEKLLAEESVGLNFILEECLSPSGILQMCEKHEDETGTFLCGRFSVGGNDTGRMKFSLFAKNPHSFMYTNGKQTFWTCTVRAEIPTGDAFEFAYPFECDRFFEKVLFDEAEAIRLFNYVRYKFDVQDIVH